MVPKTAPQCSILIQQKEWLGIRVYSFRLFSSTITNISGLFHFFPIHQENMAVINKQGPKIKLQVAKIVSGLPKMKVRDTKHKTNITGTKAPFPDQIII